MTQTLTKPNWAYRYENNAVYISADGGVTWKLFMYFPGSSTPKDTLSKR